jgi:ATP-dependent exoDNAse (exonuclease V) beta subunit
VGRAFASAALLRCTLPTASLGTWLEQIWLRLGGADCVDGTGRANLDLLWNCLDRLPDGELDLFGPTLDAALDKLTAQPDPAASSECGVQLMTIHKSKGLEFEVVIAPELQAGAGSSHGKMLSWLERGLAETDDSGEITEFLIAPFQTKGEERGKAKQWVDRVYRERESQETRRILYVAATRAREELHFFARPAYKSDANGDLSLADPTSSLLATAWPALEGDVRARFETWKKAAANSAAQGEQVLESLAAAAQSNLLVMPAPAIPTMIRRLPLDYQAAQSATWPGAPSFPRPFAERVGNHEPQLAISSPATDPSGLYSRHQGGLPSRALGNAVHTLLEELARLRATLDWENARTALQRLQPRIAAQVRATGIDQAHASAIAEQALRFALNASQDPTGQWILSPHTNAASEVSWAGIIARTLRTVRVDRVFLSGPKPLSEGEDCWWIVDYKTAHAEVEDPAAALPGLRRIFAQQVEAYAQVLRNLHGSSTPVRAGLFYPRMLLFDWWDL